MARPKSEDKRKSILDAATRIIAAHGLGAPTSLIAKEAGVSSGSLFTYFPTKRDLLNQLYMDLKTEMASASLNKLTEDASTHDRLFHAWTGWLQWAETHPDERRTLAQLSVSDEIDVQSREIGNRAMAGIAGLVDRCRADGPMRSAPLGLVANLLTGVADATVDFIVLDPVHARSHRETAFDAIWRMIA